MSFSVNFSPEDTDKVNGLGGAAWIEYLVRQDIHPELYVERLPVGYAINFDDTLATKHLPVVAEYDAPDPSELEAVYYRIVNRNAESCIEYIFYWNFQYLPPHSYDYEPIYVYLRNGKQPSKPSRNFRHNQDFARTIPKPSCHRIRNLVLRISVVFGELVTHEFDGQRAKSD